MVLKMGGSGRLVHCWTMAWVKQLALMRYHQRFTSHVTLMKYVWEDVEM